MADVPPQLLPAADASEIRAEAAGDREMRREAERIALVADTHQREATLLEDTQQLFTHLAAYLKGELSSTMPLKRYKRYLPKRTFVCRFTSFYIY